MCQENGVSELRAVSWWHRAWSKKEKGGFQGVHYLFTQRLQFLLIHKLPYPLHIIPVCHYAMFQWISDLQQPPQFFCSFPYKYIAF